MFQFVQNFFSGSWSRIQLTIDQVCWALGTIVILTLIGISLPFFGTPIEHSFYLAVPIWFFSAYRILGIRRYLNIAVAGEIIDSLQAIGPETNRTIWDSQLAAYYRKAAFHICWAQAIIFLAAPLYFNLTSNGRIWLPVLILVFSAITVASVRTSLWILRTGSAMAILIILLFAIHNLFPQVSMIPFVSEASAKIKAGKMIGENARALENIVALREKQRQKNLADAVVEAETWQTVNPGRDLPNDINEKLKAAELGLTVPEYKVRLEAEAEAKKVKAEVEAKARAEKEKAEADAKAKAEADAKAKTSSVKDSAASTVPGEKWRIREEKGEGFNEWSDAIVERDGDQIIIKTVSNGRRIIFEGKEEDGILNGSWKQQDPPNKEGKFLLKISLFGMKGYHTGHQGEKEQYPFQLKR